MKERASPYFQLHLAVALFGLAGLFGRWLNLHPILIVQGRTSFAALGLLLFLLFSRGFEKGSLSYYRNTAILGLVLAFHWFAFFKAIQLTSLALALLSFASFPLFTLMLEWLLGKERILKFDFLLVLLSLAGTFLIIPNDVNSPNFRGVIWGLASGLSFALMTVLNRSLVQNIKALRLAFHQNAFAALFLLGFSMQLDLSFTATEISLLVLLGLVFTALSHSLFVNALKSVKAKTASLIAALEPVYGIIAAYFLFTEFPSIQSILGGALIISAGLISQFRNQLKT